MSGRTAATGAAGLALAIAVGGSAPASPARCWVDKGALVASAAFGDIAGDFVIDPSTPRSELHVTRAGMAGVEADRLTRTLTIAGRGIPDFEMRVVDLDNRTRAFDTTINGVIGADLLGRYLARIDWAPCRLRLDGARRSRPRAGATRLPLRLVDGRPLVAAIASDGVHQVAGWFAIDTADWGSRITDARPSRPAPPGPTAASARIRALEVGGRLFEQTPVIIDAKPTAVGAVAGAGWIGVAVWSRWRITLDMTDGWLDLEPAEPDQ